MNKDRFDYAAITDRGLVRERNEDAWSADPENGLFVLSDGMGGRKGSGTAAKIVTQAIGPMLIPSLEKIPSLASPLVHDMVAIAISDLNAQVYQVGKTKAALDGMGATMALLAFKGKKALIAHMGDSRIYRHREGALELLTRDHTLVQLLIESGELSEEEARKHPARGQITRFIGMEGEATPDVTVVDIREGDRFLLCSDGLTGMVSEEAIAAIFRKVAGPSALCRYLLDAAIAAGGVDNITALIIDWLGEPPLADTEPTIKMDQLPHKSS